MEIKPSGSVILVIPAPAKAPPAMELTPFGTVNSSPTPIAAGENTVFRGIIRILFGNLKGADLGRAVESASTDLGKIFGERYGEIGGRSRTAEGERIFTDGGKSRCLGKVDEGVSAIKEGFRADGFERSGDRKGFQLDTTLKGIFFNALQFGIAAEYDGFQGSTTIEGLLADGKDTLVKLHLGEVGVACESAVCNGGDGDSAVDTVQDHACRVAVIRNERGGFTVGVERIAEKGVAAEIDLTFCVSGDLFIGRIRISAARKGQGGSGDHSRRENTDDAMRFFHKEKSPF